MQCIIRKGYAYYWQGKDRFGGEVVDIPEDIYKSVHQIFEPPEYAKKLLAPKVVEQPAEVKVEEPPAPVIEEPVIVKQEEVVEENVERVEEPAPEVIQEDVGNSLIKDRAVLGPRATRSKGKEEKKKKEPIRTRSLK
jgi:hypothetical protein